MLFFDRLYLILFVSFLWTLFSLLQLPCLINSFVMLLVNTMWWVLQSSCKNTILLDGQVVAILIILDKKFIATSVNAYLLTMTISLVAFVGYLLDVEFYVF